jgi:hypothetical protein
MGQNKKRRQQIAGIPRQIEYHREKITSEEAELAPNLRRIRK